jgi:hypothetical protein
MRRAVGKARERLERAVPLGLVSAFPVAAQEHARVADLRRDQAARKREGPALVEGGAVLRHANGHVLVTGRDGVAEHPPARRRVGDGDLLAQKRAQRRRGQRNGPVQNELGDVAERHLGLLLLSLDDQHFARFRHPRARLLHIERERGAGRGVERARREPALKEAHLVGQANACERALDAFRAVDERRRQAPGSGREAKL